MLNSKPISTTTGNDGQIRPDTSVVVRSGSHLDHAGKTRPGRGITTGTVN